MTESPPLSGVVLAGGHSRRLGQDKTRLQLWGPQGPTLLEVIVDRLAAVCDEVLVSSAETREWPNLPARVVYDRYPGAGALGGIYTGLSEAVHAHVLVVAGDMPFLDLDLLRYMAGWPRDYDVLIPRWRPRSVAGEAGNALWVEPLHAVYARSCQGPIEELLERGERQVIGFFPSVRVRYLDVEEWTRFDRADRSFYNINMPEDLEEVQRILRSLS